MSISDMSMSGAIFFFLEIDLCLVQSVIVIYLNLWNLLLDLCNDWVIFSWSLESSLHIFVCQSPDFMVPFPFSTLIAWFPSELDSLQSDLPFLFDYSKSILCSWILASCCFLFPCNRWESLFKISWLQQSPLFR